MIISVDSQANMAYIYLQKPKWDDSIWRNVDNKKILKYLDGREPEISIESGEKDLEY